MNYTAKEKLIISKISKECNQLKNTKAFSWISFDNLETICESISEDEFKTIYLSENFENIEKSLVQIFGNYYHPKSLIQKLHQKYKKLTSDIYKNSKIPWIKIYLIKSGYYKTIDDINNLISCSDPETRIFAVSRCSYSLLHNLRFDKDRRIRLAVYKRLGVDEYLDEMLDDKSWQIRHAAVIAAPLYYKKLEEMTNEVSGKVFFHIVRKINVKSIPYILGNKNVNNSHTKQVLSQRLLETPVNLELE